MRVLIDTNILLRSAQPTHPLSSQATSTVATLLRQKHALFFCPQNIAEFWNVATRPVGVNGLGFTQEEALQEVASIENWLTLLPDVPAIYPVWKRLVQDHRVQGAKVHDDARLVAVMNVYLIDTTLTFNVADFKRYGNISPQPPALML